MLDMNMVIANNISRSLGSHNKKQIDLAEYMGMSKQTISKMINGARAISAAELRKISEFCGTSMETLTTIPQDYVESDVCHVLMGQVQTEEAKQAIQDIDKLIELYLFHSKVKENGMAMREEWSDF